MASSGRARKALAPRHSLSLFLCRETSVQSPGRSPTLYAVGE